MKKLLTVMLCASVWMLPACGGGEPKDSAETAEEHNEKKMDDSKMEEDAEFAVKAASGGMMEVELGKLAMNNAASQEVKDFGQQMVTDHTAGNNELMQLAQSKNITLPSAPGEDKQETIADLSKKTGAEFDKAYMDYMVKDHKEDIEEFQHEGEKGNDAEIKAWAADKVATLQHHLSMAEEIQKKLK